MRGKSMHYPVSVLQAGNRRATRGWEPYYMGCPSLLQNETHNSHTYRQGGRADGNPCMVVKNSRNDPIFLLSYDYAAPWKMKSRYIEKHCFKKYRMIQNYFNKQNAQIKFSMRLQSLYSIARPLQQCFTPGASPSETWTSEATELWPSK